MLHEKDSRLGMLFILVLIEARNIFLIPHKLLVFINCSSWHLKCAPLTTDRNFPIDEAVTTGASFLLRDFLWRQFHWICTVPSVISISTSSHFYLAQKAEQNVLILHFIPFQEESNLSSVRNSPCCFLFIFTFARSIRSYQCQNWFPPSHQEKTKAKSLACLSSPIIRMNSCNHIKIGQISY